MSQKRRYTLTVLEKIEETDDSCTIKFKQPGLKKINYQPGQFITLILNINGRIYQRPYSVSSVFGIDQTIDITVKAIENGVVSNYIKSTLNIGHSIEIIEPLGTFILPTVPSSTIMLWAAGSGISPIFAILKQLLNNTNTEVILNYSSRNINQVILLSEIEKLHEKFSSKFQCNLFLSQVTFLNDKKFKCQQKLKESNVNEMILKNNINKDVLHYICGPNQYNIFVQNSLAANGIKTENIKIEDFNQILDAEDLRDINDTWVKINVGTEEHSFFVKKGESILNAALDMGINIDYSCQTGTCELCFGNILEGELKMITHHKKEIKIKGESCLLCCSLPLTNNLKISVN